MAPTSRQTPSRAGRCRRYLFSPSAAPEGIASSCCIGGASLRRREVGARQRRLDQRNRLRHPIERDEASEAWSFELAKQHLIEAAEPGPQLRERMPLTDLI